MANSEQRNIFVRTPLNQFQFSRDPGRLAEERFRAAGEDDSTISFGLTGKPVLNSAYNLRLHTGQITSYPVALPDYAGIRPIVNY